MIRFDEATHTYWNGSQRIPSVTEVLKPLSGYLNFVDEDLLAYKSALGTAVHKAVELHILDGLDYSSLVDPVKAYFNSYLTFVKDTGFKASHSEMRVHSKFGYAGTLDLIGRMNIKGFMIDLKTCTVLSPAVALQLSAYFQAAKEQGIVGLQDYSALRLSETGYTLKNYPRTQHASDFSAFIALLRIKQWCDTTKSQMEIQAA